MKDKILKIIIVLIFIVSLALGVHNASLYDPSQGFDGSPHVYYVEFIKNYGRIPPPDQFETHQPPLYYIISALVHSLTGNIKSIQYVNIAVLWLIIVVVSLGLFKIFKNKYLVFIGALSLVSLPMLNIFTPAVTNELLNTFWIISALVSGIYLYYSKTKKEFTRSFLFLLFCLVMGIWTKVTIITIIPTILVILYLSSKNIKKFFILSTALLMIFGLAYLPVYLRAAGSKSPSNVLLVASKLSNKRPLDFYIRLDWIPKVDMYNTQYYSLLGGAWNSFWSDGQNQITPFVPFHKKAFILWTLGFVLLPISLYGLYLQFKENKKIAIFIAVMDISMLAFYLVYNMVSNHYSAARLTYQMGIVLPYAYGIAAAGKNKKIFPLIILLLAIQFLIMVSFFWIQPWWFVTSPKAL